jgi:hypothetical protein
MVNSLSHVSRKLVGASLPIALLLITSVLPKAKGTSAVQVSVLEESKSVAGSPVYLDHLKDAECAKLFSDDSGSGSNDGQSVEEMRALAQRAASCVTKTQSAHTDKQGIHAYEGLEDGWYRIRLQWPMSQPPASKDPIGCQIEGWSVSYVPWKESGKNRGFAQAPAFELKSGETRKVNFDYSGRFKITADCPNPVKWTHRN